VLRCQKFSLTAAGVPGGGALGLGSGFDPPDLDGPGRLPHQQGLCEARLGYRDGSPQLGAPGPGLERAGRHQGIHVMWSCKEGGEGG
jgi:hypothetical protein